MGWKGKLVGKVGHYLSQSVEVPLKHLYTYAAGPRVNIAQEDTQGAHVFQEDFQHLSETNNETVGNVDDEYGPDTTSLTAFLLSLLSGSNNSSRRCSDSPEDSEPEPDNNASASSSGSWEHHSTNEESSSNKAFGIHSEGSERRVHPVETDDSNMTMSNSFRSRLHATLQQASPTTSLKLPPMSENSVLLSENFRAFIYSVMPIIVQDRHWILLYSTAKHGISLRTLYRKSAALSDPFLLVAGDFHGATFGGLLTAPLKATSKRKYLGTNEMFVFTNVNENPRIFKATDTTFCA